MNIIRPHLHRHTNPHTRTQPCKHIPLTYTMCWVGINLSVLLKSYSICFRIKQSVLTTISAVVAQQFKYISVINILKSDFFLANNNAEQVWIRRGTWWKQFAFKNSRCCWIDFFCFMFMLLMTMKWKYAGDIGRKGFSVIVKQCWILQKY